MLKFFQGLSKLLANYTSIFVIGVAVFTFFFPHTFDWVRGTTQTVILGIIMLTMGLTLTTNDFKILAQRPLDVFIGACAQFIIMPGVAYTLVSDYPGLVRLNDIAKHTRNEIHPVAFDDKGQLVPEKSK